MKRKERDISSVKFVDGLRISSQDHRHEFQNKNPIQKLCAFPCVPGRLGFMN